MLNAYISKYTHWSNCESLPLSWNSSPDMLPDRYGLIGGKLSWLFSLFSLPFSKMLISSLHRCVWEALLGLRSITRQNNTHPAHEHDVRITHIVQYSQIHLDTRSPSRGWKLKNEDENKVCINCQDQCSIVIWTTYCKKCGWKEGHHQNRYASHVFTIPPRKFCYFLTMVCDSTR